MTAVLGLGRGGGVGVGYDVHVIDRADLLQYVLYKEVWISLAIMKKVIAR